MIADEEEDNEAVDYPVHNRYAATQSTSALRKHQEEEQEPPSLAQIAKENTMSFGMMGKALKDNFAKQDEYLFSEQSDDFYSNTGRSNFTNTLS